jgi:ArsR family transcriptional regulator
VLEARLGRGHEQLGTSESDAGVSRPPGGVEVPRPIPDWLIELVARRFRVLGQPMRVHLLDELDRRGETNVQTLADELSATQQNASRHLSVLTQAGLLARRQDGRVVWYRLANPEPFGLIETTAAELLDELRQLDSGD